MKKDDHKSKGDEEYQYPSEEYVMDAAPQQQEEEVAVETKPPLSRVGSIACILRNNRRVVAVVVVAVVALIAFKLFGMHDQSKKAVKPKQATIHQPVMQAPPVQRLSMPATGQLNGLKQDTQTNETAINRLENQVQGLQSQLSQAEAQRTQLNQSMVVLLGQVKNLSSKVSAATAPKIVKKSEKPSAPPPPPVVYHLKAIVPGRAWIVSNDGLSESVSVGDTVDQYGKVQAVDANRGMVMTSSGKVIDYGSNDH